MYTDIPLEKIDCSILGTISEDQVTMWLAARMRQIQLDGIPVHALSINLHYHQFYNPPRDYIASGVTIHAADACEGRANSKDALEYLLRKIGANDPIKQARLKRKEAEDLLAEAKALEQIANPTPRSPHTDVFEKMDEIQMPAELKRFVESGHLEYLLVDQDGSLCFNLPKHTQDRDIITLTWYPLEQNPDAETHFDLTIAKYRDKDCTDPLGSNDVLDHPAKLADLIDYLDDIPE